MELALSILFGGVFIIFCVWTYLLRRKGQRLDEREKSIIFMRYFQGRTQMEIANEIGISQAQVSRLEKGALERIKKQV